MTLKPPRAQLDALGRFAGSVAHDINNMLFGINGFIDLALAQEIDDEAERHLQKRQRRRSTVPPR